jgi:hypothetical protein
MRNAGHAVAASHTSDSSAAGLLIAWAMLGSLLFAAGAAGQERSIEPVESFQLFGQVVDAESGVALQGAWVGLTDTDWGSITDSDGRFRIPDLDPGRLSLTIEQLGYETLEWAGDVASGEDLLVIGMTAEPILLEGLEVVTDRFRSRRRAAAISAFAYDAGDLATATERTALDFVRFRTMGMTQCNGRWGNTCLWVRGRAIEPTVYIDEMPLLGGLTYLETFAPWEFHMIEIYGQGRHIRAYTPQFMKRAAEIRLLPLPLFM